MFPNLDNGKVIYSAILNDDELKELFGSIVPLFHPGTWIFLEGEVGAGKTFLVQELFKYLSIDGETSSPTFAVLNRINISESENLALPFSTIIHIDFYRLKSGRELCYLGIEAELHPQALLMAEWASLMECEDWENFFSTTYCPTPQHIVQINIEYLEHDPLKRKYEVIFFSPQS